MDIMYPFCSLLAIAVNYMKYIDNKILFLFCFENFHEYVVLKISRRTKTCVSKSNLASNRFALTLPVMVLLLSTERIQIPDG